MSSTVTYIKIINILPILPRPPSTQPQTTSTMIRPTTPSNPSQMSIPPRSTTFPAKPTHKHHIPHHPHRVHHHHHDKSVPQSAILPTTSNPFGDFLSKTNSKLDGRVDGNKTPPRGSEQQPGNERVSGLKEAEKERDRDRETLKEVERLKATRNAADEYVYLQSCPSIAKQQRSSSVCYGSDLRTRLTTLATLSTATTRRLDYTYYSLLSSISSLASAVSSLSSLSTQTSSLQTQFTSSSSGLASEITFQISSSQKSFDAQACRISQLEMRIKEGREKVGRLGERLDGVREKVERSSLRDRESRRIIGRRLKMLWGSLGFLIGLFLILAATRQWRRNEDVIKGESVHLGNRTEEPLKEAVGMRQENGELRREMRRDDERWRPGTKTSMRVGDTTARSSAVDADATLRLFDEL